METQQQNLTQSTVSLYDDKFATFRIFWTIPNFLQISQTDEYYITNIVSVIPENFICRLEIFRKTNDDSEGETSETIQYSSFYLRNEIAKDIWITFRVAVIDKNYQKPYAYYTDIVDVNAENAYGFEDCLPTNLSTQDSDLVLPNGYLQILVEGQVWLKEPLSKDWKSEIVKDCSLTNSSELLRSGMHSDVTFSVGNDQFQVHKNILSSRSAVFENMFKGEYQNIQVIQDMKPEVLREVLHFIYNDHVTVLIDAMLPDVLKAAHKYELHKLKNICELKMIGGISLDNAFDILLIADEVYAESLKQKTFEFILTNRKTITANQSWKTFKSTPSDLLSELCEKFMEMDL